MYTKRAVFNGNLNFMIDDGSSKASFLLPNTVARCESLLYKYAASRSLPESKRLHAHIITSGLLSSSSYIRLRFRLVKAYAQCNQNSYSRQVFDELPEPSLFSWNVMIKMYAQSNRPRDALKMFVEMLASGKSRPDYFTYPLVIKACGELCFIEFGVGIHGRTFVAGFSFDTFVQNSLLAMYMNCGEKETAQRVFDAMQVPDVVSWNTMVNGYFRNNCAKEALMVFCTMKDLEVEPDCATIISVLPVCGLLKDLEFGKQVHALAGEKGLGGNIAVRNALVDMYVKCGRMDEARIIVNGMDEKDVVTWTTIINGYILNGDSKSALALCGIMQLEGVKPNAATIASLLLACASSVCLMQGKCLHGWAIRQNLESEVFVETALIDIYAKCNRMDQSYGVFIRSSKNRTVPWNALLSGFIHNGFAREAIELFKEMLMEEIETNLATLSSLLPAYAILADLQQATIIHCYLLRFGFLYRFEVATLMVDVYSKCGSLEYAYEIFCGIPHNDKDIVMWSALIAAYGKHGDGRTAVFLFNQMIQSGIKPNEVTFTSVLHACSHSGLVDKGLGLFNFMCEHNLIVPHADHYTCIVDLLGRAGRLYEAYDLIRRMPIRPNHAVWGALLGACVIHEKVEIGEIAAKWLFELEPENTGNYVLLAKLYAASGRWEDAENIRYKLNKVGLRKAPAHSLIGARNM